METIKEIRYKYDGHIFASEEDLNNYKQLFIEDNKLFELYKFFYTSLPEDEGDYNSAKWPSDATKYIPVIIRLRNGTHSISFKRLYKSNGGKECSENTYNSVIIRPNRDFEIGYKKTEIGSGMMDYTSKGYCTNNIVQYINKLEELDIFIPDLK